MLAVEVAERSRYLFAAREKVRIRIFAGGAFRADVYALPAAAAAAP